VKALRRSAFDWPAGRSSFGPCAQLRFAKLSRAPFRDRAYLRELDRRNRILSGRPFVMPALPSPKRALLPGIGVTVC
jgi:hypothetical protein